MVKANFKALKLRGCKSNQRPKKRIFLDIETHIIKTETGTDLPLRLAVAKYEYWDSHTKQYRCQDRHFWSSKDLWKYCLSKIVDNERLLIITHNAAFDMLASSALPFLEAAHFKLTFYYDKGMVFIMSCQRDKAKIQIISNTNFYPTSIKELGKMLDLPKYEVDFEDMTDEELLPYCQRDVEILYQSFKRWENMVYNENLGMLRLTKASQAFTAYCHRFMKYGIYVHEDEEAKLLERESYCGGRCEALRIGVFEDGPFVKLDFNSNYAYVMRNNPYPTRITGILNRPHHYLFLSTIKEFLCVASVQIQTDVPVYPIKRGGKLIFPVGVFEATLCTPALLYAIKHNHIKYVNTVCCYNHKYIFSDYVNFFYNKKVDAQEKGNLIERKIFKDLLNTLYGKFAEQHPITEFIDTDTGESCSTHINIYQDKPVKETEHTIMGRKMHVTGIEDSKHTFTAISSHVTEYARMLLWSIIEQVGWRNIYYMDTDSIIIKEKDIELIKHHISDEALGALSIEGVADRIEIRAPKDYTFGDEVKHKGIPKRATRLEDGSYQYDQFQGIRSRLTEGDVTQAATRTIIKDPTYEITKGKVGRDGRVYPFLLPDDDDLLSILP